MFFLAYDGAFCPNMKLNTLDRIYTSLKEEKYLITIPENVAAKARVSLERMFQIKS
jgi:quinolinate synthase